MTYIKFLRQEINLIFLIACGNARRRRKIISMRTTPRRHDIAQEFVDREDAWQDFVEGHGRHRLVFEGRDRLLPELHLLGWLKFRRAMANALWPSQHRGFFEIHYIVHGNLHWWVEQQDYPLGPGMLLVIRPDELHGAQNAVLDPCEHYWIQIDLRTPKNLPGLQLKESREICELLATRQARRYCGGEPIRDTLEKLVEEHRHPEPFSKLLARSLLHQFLIQVSRAVPLEDATQQAAATTARDIWRAVSVIREKLEDPPSVAELSALLGMSENTLRREFRRKTGLTPLEFVTSMRIKKAKAMLCETDMDITEISSHLGFSTSQYFATVFSKTTGLTPRDYRKQGEAKAGGGSP
jgi:AraC-like DNA-binding protein/mannose-6-phosphate isomerase-like protein (cupin superfamily)